jgi:chemotaxis signal transduction protein
MPQQFVMVTVADRRRLVRLSDVREIVSLMALADVDGRRGRCRGMANLRGEMVPVFDLAGSDARLSPSRVIIMACVEGHTVGLLVDDVQDVVSVADDQVAERPAGGGGSVTLVRMENEILGVLEPADAIRET